MNQTRASLLDRDAPALDLGLPARPLPGKTSLTSRLAGRGGAPGSAPALAGAGAGGDAAVSSGAGAVQRDASGAPVGPDPFAVHLLADGRATDGGGAAATTTATVQRDASGGAAVALDPSKIHLHASRGIADGGGALPHIEAIQRAFGHHDVAGVRAHVGGAASEAAAAIGARAYASGDHVAFAAAPDLRLAAHEAAHVVQQRGGVRLAGGVGQVGDAYEQHADAVADLVVRGESAQALLDTMAHRGAGGGPAVQGDFTPAERAAARGAMIDDVAMEQIAHRIAYLDGRLPPPSAEEVEDGAAASADAPAAAPAPAPAPASAPDSTAAHPREALRHADVDRLDREALAALGFDVDHFQFFSGANGLQFWTLPTLASSPRPGIIAFRGTEADGPRDEAIADLTEDATPAGVGMSQFSANQGAIAQALRQLATRHPVVATGHSLGGALAQIATCFYPELICSVVTFQAPGIPQAVLDRLARLPADRLPDAHHHRVDGCIVDEAGEGFVGGLPGADGERHDATLYGHSGLLDGTFIDPVHAHTSFPLLSGAEADGSREGWMRSAAPAVDPALVAHVEGSTEDPSFGRTLGGVGLGEWGRTHPATLLGGLGAVLGDGVGGALGVGAGLAIDAAAGPRDLYTRLWMTAVEHIEAVDGTFEQLKQRYIVDACAEASRRDFIRPMTSNFQRAYPEFAAAHQVARTHPEALEDEGRFLVAVGELTALDSTSRGRVSQLWHRERGLGADHATAAPSSAPDRDQAAAAQRRAEILARLERGQASEPAPVQPDGGSAASAVAVREAASRGTSGPAQALPHLEAIQASFGHHQVGGVRAHVGGAAAEATGAIGAEAYASGDHVVFSSAPDLRQAAHEAAHVVQQRGGVQLDGGVGRAGDPYEEHAEAVAQKVVRGESAEALLDERAPSPGVGAGAAEHVRASGGLAVQQLVNERDAAAVNTIVGLLADASPAEIAAIGEGLLGGIHAAMMGRVRVTFHVRDEDYDLMIPLVDARLLCNETGYAGSHALATADTSRREARRRTRRTLRSLHRPSSLATLITGLGGEVGEETEVELTLRVPISGTPLHATGEFTMSVEHSRDGYELEFEPRLGIGVGAGGGDADILLGSRVEVTGHDAQAAAELALVAIEHQFRAAAAGAVPAPLLQALIVAGLVAPEVTAVVVIGDLVGRLANYASTGDPSDPVLLWLADLIFGEGHIAEVAATMTGEDSVETVDTLSLEVEGGAGDGAHRREVEVSMGTGGHWAMEAGDGGAGTEFRTIDLAFAADFPPWHGGVEAHFPLRRGEHVPTGEIEIELAARVETHSARLVLDADLFGRLCALISGVLADHRERSPDTIEAAEARVADLEAARGALASALRSRLAVEAVASGAAAEVGVQLEIDLHLGGRSEAVVKLTDGFEAEEHGSGGSYHHARALGEPVVF
ncbi:MAG: DUF4157 domain-containing protein [Kofleriaceae bacterium]